MKRHLLSLTFLGLAAIPAIAQPRPTAFFGVGFTEPVNPLARTLDTGWNLSGGVGVMNEYVGLTLDGLYTDMGVNRHASRGFDGRDRFWALTLNPRVHLNDHGPIDFYITGGGGLYSRISDVRAFNDRDYFTLNTIYKGGVNGGVGFAYRIPFGHVKFFAEARYHHMFTPASGDSFIPVTFGISW